MHTQSHTSSRGFVLFSLFCSSGLRVLAFQTLAENLKFIFSLRTRFDVMAW
jgi:hypothetical protein